MATILKRWWLFLHRNLDKTPLKTPAIPFRSKPKKGGDLWQWSCWRYVVSVDVWSAMKHYRNISQDAELKDEHGELPADWMWVLPRGRVLLWASRKWGRRWWWGGVPEHCESRNSSRQKQEWEIRARHFGWMAEGMKLWLSIWRGEIYRCCGGESNRKSGFCIVLVLLRGLQYSAFPISDYSLISRVFWFCCLKGVLTAPCLVHVGLLWSSLIYLLNDPA